MNIKRFMTDRTPICDRCHHFVVGEQLSVAFLPKQRTHNMIITNGYDRKYDAPFTSTIPPVKNSVPADAKNSTVRATSSGVATRPAGL